MTEELVKLPALNLQPGEIQLVRSPSILQTILGSCVSATFWSRRMGAGLYATAFYPGVRRTGRWALPADGHRFVDFSIRYLAKQFDQLGANRKEVEVKLFGGADVLPVSTARQAKPTVGALNCRAALEALEDEGFIVIACDLGGIRGRRIHFNTGTGEVLVQKLGAWSDRL